MRGWGQQLLAASRRRPTFWYKMVLPQLSKVISPPVDNIIWVQAAVVVIRVRFRHQQGKSMAWTCAGMRGVMHRCNGAPNTSTARPPNARAPRRVGPRRATMCLSAIGPKVHGAGCSCARCSSARPCRALNGTNSSQGPCPGAGSHRRSCRCPRCAGSVRTPCTSAAPNGVL